MIALNPALEEMLGGRSRVSPSLCFADLICSEERAEGQRLFQELFDRQCDSFHIDTHIGGGDGRPVRWTTWRVPGTNGNSDYALALAEDAPHDQQSAQRLRQAEKLEAVGRLAGGVAHDFNNLLTGIFLYCDLLKAHLEPCHRVRKYADEIRNAGMQAAGLVRQLLAVARPSNSESRLLSLNEIVEGMRTLLSRLIGENINLLVPTRSQRWLDQDGSHAGATDPAQPGAECARCDARRRRDYGGNQQLQSASVRRLGPP